MTPTAQQAPESKAAVLTGIREKEIRNAATLPRRQKRPRATKASKEDGGGDLQNNEPISPFVWASLKGSSYLLSGAAAGWMASMGDMQYAPWLAGMSAVSAAMTAKHLYDGVRSHFRKADKQRIFDELAEEKKTGRRHPKEEAVAGHFKGGGETDGGQARIASKPKSQIDSPAFQKWFGESKVTGEDGKPLRVYHGTRRSFDQFIPDKATDATGAKTSHLGHFFTDKTSVADSFASGDGGNVIPAYLAIKNPFEISDFESNFTRVPKPGSVFGEKRRKPHAKPEMESFSQLHSFIQNVSKKETWEQVTEEDVKAFRKRLIDRGYDGIVVKDTTMDAGYNYHGEPQKINTHYIAFQPTQIKSAIGNQGTFDPQDPRIHKKEGGEAAAGEDWGEQMFRSYRRGVRRENTHAFYGAVSKVFGKDAKKFKHLKSAAASIFGRKVELELFGSNDDTISVTFFHDDENSVGETSEKEESDYTTAASLQKGSLSFAKKLAVFAREAAGRGLKIAYTTEGRREDVYARSLAKLGMRPTDPGKGDYKHSVVWEPPEPDTTNPASHKKTGGAAGHTTIAATAGEAIIPPGSGEPAQVQARFAPRGTDEEPVTVPSGSFVVREEQARKPANQAALASIAKHGGASDPDNREALERINAGEDAGEPSHFRKGGLTGPPPAGPAGSPSSILGKPRSEPRGPMPSSIMGREKASSGPVVKPVEQAEHGDEPVTEPDKPSIFSPDKAKILTAPPPRRFTREQWDSMGAAAWDVAEAMQMGPPEGIAPRNPPAEAASPSRPRRAKKGRQTAAAPANPASSAGEPAPLTGAAAAQPSVFPPGNGGLDDAARPDWDRAATHGTVQPAIVVPPGPSTIKPDAGGLDAAARPNWNSASTHGTVQPAASKTIGMGTAPVDDDWSAAVFDSFFKEPSKQGAAGPTHHHVPFPRDSARNLAGERISGMMQNVKKMRGLKNRLIGSIGSNSWSQNADLHAQVYGRMPDSAGESPRVSDEKQDELIKAIHQLVLKLTARPEVGAAAASDGWKPTFGSNVLPGQTTGARSARAPSKEHDGVQKAQQIMQIMQLAEMASAAGS